MNSHRSTKLILQLTPCIAAMATVIVSVPQSPASAVAGGGMPGAPRRAAAVIAAGAEPHLRPAVRRHGEVLGTQRPRTARPGRHGLPRLRRRHDGRRPARRSTSARDVRRSRSPPALGHTCALLDDRTVKCWGYNASGQLGQGDAADRGDSPGELGDNLAAVDLGTGRTATAIAAGGYHTCAILDDASVKCWGYDNCRRARTRPHRQHRRRTRRDGRQPARR